MTKSNEPHPTRTEFEDWVELADGRIWMLGFEKTDCSENIPRLFLEQYTSDDLWADLQEDGRVWLLPEDMPRVIEMLAKWLDLYRECASDDSTGPRPRPNWGNLSRSVLGDDR